MTRVKNSTGGIVVVMMVGGDHLAFQNFSKAKARYRRKPPPRGRDSYLLELDGH